MKKNVEVQCKPLVVAFALTSGFLWSLDIDAINASANPCEIN